MSVGVPVVTWEQTVEGLAQIGLRTRVRFHQRKSSGRVRHEHVYKAPHTHPSRELAHLVGDIDLAPVRSVHRELSSPSISRLHHERLVSVRPARNVLSAKRRLADL